MRRKDREMSPDFAYMVIKDSDFVTLSMITPDDLPYAVPIQMVENQGQLYFHCAKEGEKLNCLRGNPHVCISCVRQLNIVPEALTTKYQSAIFQGTAMEVMDREKKIGVLQLLCQKYAPTHMEKAKDEISTYLSATSIWEVSVTSATGKEHI